MVTVNLGEVDFTKNNITFTNGLTLEKVKMKYNWLLNAKVEDALIGEDANGLVWYSGNWLCGEWYSGTWYSGNFSGVWKNGNFYSYKLEKFDILNNYFNPLYKDDSLSQFLSGIWENGNFYSGTFGKDVKTDWSSYTLFKGGIYIDGEYPVFQKEMETAGGNIENVILKTTTWLSGTFINGIMYDSVWNDGIFKNGKCVNIQWLNGKFFNGVFDGNTWYDGIWFNGDFIRGVWKTGVFRRSDTTIISRFGYTNLDYHGVCIWENGKWENGDFYSGIPDTENNTIKNYISLWLGGDWMNGVFYSGHFKAGTIYNGIFKTGIIGDISVSEWVKPKDVFQVNDRSLYWSNVPVNYNITNVTGESLRLLSGYENSAKYDTFESFNWITPNTNRNWGFDYIDNNLLVSKTLQAPFNIGDEIYIISDIYTGESKIKSISATSLKIEIGDISGVPFDKKGGIVYKKEDYISYINNMVSNIIGFRNFDFGNIEKKINGYQIRYKRKVNKSYYSEIRNKFSDNDVWFNTGIIKNNNGVLVNSNIIEYSKEIFNDNTDTYIDNNNDAYNIENVRSGYKNRTKIDEDEKEVVYGIINDTWTLENLNDYSHKSGLTTNPVYLSDINNLFNIDINNPVFNNGNYFIDEVGRTINIYMKFNSSYSNGDTLSIRDVSMRLFFEDSPVTFKGGIIENCIWINGDFENGKFNNGIWLNGYMKNGEIGVN